MFKHYELRTISGEEFDRLVEVAKRDAELRWYEGDLHILAEEEDGQTDEEFDGHAMGILDAFGEGEEDEWGYRRHELDGYDLLCAVDAHGLRIGTIYGAPNCKDKIIHLDADALTDAKAWGIWNTLPEWVRERLQKSVDAGHSLYGS